MKRPATVSVRRGSIRDVEFLVRLAKTAFGAYSNAPERSILSMLQHSGSRALVAEVEGNPVGYAIVSFRELGRPYGPWSNPTLASLDAIAVMPSAQRMGIGKALLSSVESLARTERAVSIHLRTAVSNHRAQSAFKSAGYQPVFTIPTQYKNSQDAFAMMKVLDL
ncbi:MAG: GNAT family N-acetyltransferase [Polyangiaceae bacterium]|nr:GNAT family N-acetyltransferase [Polyangiaceae bacterium]